jgi:hypothetical protein
MVWLKLVNMEYVSSTVYNQMNHEPSLFTDVIMTFTGMLYTITPNTYSTDVILAPRRRCWFAKMSFSEAKIDTAKKGFIVSEKKTRRLVRRSLKQRTSVLTDNIGCKSTI